MEAKGAYKFNFLLVRNKLFLYLVPVLFFSFLAYLSWDRYNELNSENLNIKGKYLSMKKTFQKHNNIKEAIINYKESYKVFNGENYFRNDHRLHWLEMIGQIDEKDYILNLDYRLGALDHLDNANMTSSLSIKTMPVFLKFSLLHEGDLLKMFNYLDELKPGLYKVDSCDLISMGELSMELLDDNQIAVECQLLTYAFNFSHT